MSIVSRISFILLLFLLPISMRALTIVPPSLGSHPSFLNTHLTRLPDYQTTYNIQHTTHNITRPQSDSPISRSSDYQTISLPDSLLPTPTFDYRNTRYWNRNRVKLFSGSSLLAIGACSFTLCGFVCFVIDTFDDANSNDAAVWALATMLPSAAVMSASIPLFVSARKDRARARAMADEVLTGNLPARDYRATGMRFEVMGGITLPLEDVVGSRTVGWSLGFEGRGYLGQSRFDLAGRFMLDDTRYASTSNHQTVLRASILSDYNFLKGQHINPYVGLGLGLSILPIATNFEPRVGLEISSHHRISLSSHICIPSKDPYDESKQSSNLSLLYGYTF